MHNKFGNTVFIGKCVADNFKKYKGVMAIAMGYNGADRNRRILLKVLWVSWVSWMVVSE